MTESFKDQSSFSLEKIERPELKWEDGFAKISIKGEISGPFFIHDSGDGCAILTHIPTGFRIVKTRNRMIAKGCASDLSKYDWDSVRVEDGKTIGFSDSETQEIIRIRNVYMS